MSTDEYVPDEDAAPVTVQPTRDQLRALANAATPGPWELTGGGEYVTGVSILVAPDDGGVTSADAEFIAAARTALPQLLDQLAAAEHRIRDLTQEVRDERGAALDQMEQVRVRDARIQAVQDVIARGPHEDARGNAVVLASDIRRALESGAAPGP